VSEHEAPPPAPGAPPRDEAELRAALEAELARITVADVLLQTIVTLVNLAGRRLGLHPGGEQERDLGQAREAIDGVRALLPIVEASEDEELGPIKDALAQLQLAYARLAQEGGAPSPPEGSQPPPDATKPGDPGPAQRSGRLWVPGRDA